MQIQLGIPQLLWKYNCVTLPGLGGFVANEVSARLNRSTGVFNPPSRQIAFNVNLTQNDGLLIQHLAQVNGVSYADAENLVAREIADIKQQLADREPFLIAQVGTLFTNQEGNLQFVAADEVTFLNSSYGLRKLYVIPRQVAAEPALSGAAQKTPAVSVESARIIPLQVEKSAESSPPPQEERPNRMPWLRVAALIGFPLAAAFAYWMAGSTQSRPQAALARLLPDTPAVEAHYDPGLRQAAGFTPVPNLPETTALASVSDTVVRWNFNSNSRDSKGTVVRLIEPIANLEGQPQSEPELTAPEELPFQIIGGCFAVEANALRYAREQNVAGVQAYLYDKRNGLYRVSLGGFNNEAEALLALENYKTSNYPAAWMIRH